MLSKDSNNQPILDSSIPLSLEEFMKATGATQETAIKYLEFMKGTMKAFDITTRARIASFLSQVAHESGNLNRTVENLNYSAKGLRNVWPRHFPTDQIADDYARKPERIANRAYANRMGNGDESSGDGWLYRGRSFIQLTGKNNYKAISEYFGEDFVSNPDLILEPVWCCLAAGWFWHVNNLNDLADIGDHKRITKRINGGYIGLEDRMKKLDIATLALSNFQNLA